MLRDDVDERALVRLAHVERARDRRHDEAWIPDRRKLDEDHAIREFIDDSGGNLQGETRLSGASGTRHGDEAGAPQPIAQRCDLALAADERREPCRQVVHPKVERAQWGEVGLEAGRDDLVDVLLLQEAGEAALAHVAKRDIRWKTITQCMGGVPRNEDLPTMCRGHESCGTIDHRPVVVPVGDVHLTRMQGHAGADLHLQCLGYGLEGALGVERRGKPVEWIDEHGMEAVAHRLDDMTSMRLDRRAQRGIVPRKRGLHRHELRLPQASASLHVGEQERDAARWQLARVVHR